MEKIENKKILILGAGIAALEVVKRCQKLGIKTYVTDYNYDSPAKKVADKSFLISPTEVDQIVEICKEEGIDGIYTGPTESFIPYYVEICKKMNYYCYGTEETFEIMLNKKRFKDICKKYGVPLIQEYKLNDTSISFPVIVKPVDSAGSKGITVCYNKLDLEKGFSKAMSFSPSKQVIIEKYMSGDEVVAYYYFQNGNPVFVGMCDRYVYKQTLDSVQLPIAYIFPSIHTKEHITNTDPIVKNMFRKINMTNGPLFLQAFMENGMLYPYEPGYRTNGAREQYIIGETTGLNSVDMLISFALNGHMANFDIEKKANPYLNGKIACKLSPLLRKGKINKIVGLDELRNHKGIIETITYYSVGDEINDRCIGTLQQIAFRTYVVADTKEELKKIIDFVQNTVNFYDEKGESMILSLFDSSIIMRKY